MKYFKKPVRVTESSFYCVKDKDGKVLYNATLGTVCFYKHFVGYMDKEIALFEINIPSANISYTEEFTNRWINFINNDLILPVRYMGRVEGQDIIHIPMFNEVGEPFYPKRLAFNTCLTLVRYLWHDILNVIPSYFFEYCELMPDEDKVKLLFAAHSFGGSTLGHSLTNKYYIKLHDINYWKDKIQSDEELMYDENKFSSVNLNTTWGTKGDAAYGGYYSQPDRDYLKTTDLKERFDLLNKY